MILIVSMLMVSNQLITSSYMHNLYAIFAKYLDICKQFAGNLVNEQGNMPRCGAVPRFSDLEVVALSMVPNPLALTANPFCLLNCKSIN